jgi:PAS domain S-box-containing protein
VKAIESLETLKHLGTDPFLAALARSSDDAIIGKTLDGRVVFWNAAAERLYGYGADEMLGSDIALLIPPDRPQELSELLAQVGNGETVRNLQTERLRKDGARIPVSITVSPVLADDGTVIGGSTIAHDLTRHLFQVAELQSTQRHVAEAQATLKTLQESAPVGFGFMDREFRITHLNEMLASVNGSTVADQLGKTVAEVVPEIWPQIEPVYRRVLDRDEPVLNVETSGETAADPGRTHHWLASYYPVHLGNEIIGVGVVAVDITERRQAEEFHSNVMNNMAEGLISVDTEGRLTSMNAAATKMLGWTAEDLRGRLVSEVILARGDDGRAVREDANELLKVRAEGRHLRLDDFEYVCKNGTQLSVAISASPLLNGSSVEGAVVVFRDITDEKSERLRVKRELDALSWVGRIREALDEDRFVLFSQPIVPLRGGQPSSELLIRMKGRNGELIAPNSFLPVAEKYGLIDEIDQWVVKQAVGLASQSHHVGVNLSAASIVTFDLLAMIKQELEQADADPSNLVFEITETALMRDIEKGEAFARGVTDLGCGLALDDFGTGFGTFTYLKRLPINYLKIDIEFVRDLVASSANQHVVAAIVTLAQGFGCQTIAEGVEDGATLKLLEDFGVDFAQGYHLGRPAPVQHITMLAETA